MNNYYLLVIISLNFLHINKLPVKAVLCDQLLVVSSFHDPASLQYDDLVRVADGGETVGDHDARAVLHHVINGVLHQSFAFGVEG